MIYKNRLEHYHVVQVNCTGRCDVFETASLKTKNLHRLILHSSMNLHISILNQTNNNNHVIII